MVDSALVMLCGVVVLCRIDCDQVNRTSKIIQRHLHWAVAGAFTLIFLCSIWPIYPFFSRIFPMVLGMPFSLVYLLFLSLLVFLILLGLYFWEAREDKSD